MSSCGFAALGAFALGAHPDESNAPADPLSAKLLRGADVETIVFIQLFNRPVAAAASLGAESEALGALALGAAPDELAGAGAEDRLLLSDGAWCGRPDDVGAAHLEADPRLIDIGDVQDETPYLPWQDRRQTTSVATIRAANGDGALDDFLVGRTIDGQAVQGFLGRGGGYVGEWIRVLDAIGASADPEIDECRFEISSVASLLDAPLLTLAYAGTGGAQGGGDLAGKYVPLLFGACFNVAPDLEDAGEQIDRWSAAAINNVVVKDGGAPLIWDGNDWPTYAALRAAAVDPGFYTKATPIGRTKRGAEAVYRITGDVDAPLNKTADILLASARGAAGLSEDLINAGSFGVLPADRIDLFLKGDSQITVGQLYDALLAPFNAWWGGNGDRRLSVGMIGSPEGIAPAWTVSNDQVFADSLTVQQFDIAPVWRLGVAGARNWTPMTADSLVDYTENPALSQADWERLQRGDTMAEASDSAVKQRHRGAFDSVETEGYGAIRSYFTDIAGAQAAADRLFAFLKQPMRKISFATGLNAIFARPGAAGTLQYDGRLALAGGRAGMAVSRRFSAADREIALTVLAPVN